MVDIIKEGKFNDFQWPGRGGQLEISLREHLGISSIVDLRTQNEKPFDVLLKDSETIADEIFTSVENVDNAKKEIIAWLENPREYVSPYIETQMQPQKLNDEEEDELEVL